MLFCFASFFFTTKVGYTACLPVMKIVNKFTPLCSISPLYCGVSSLLLCFNVNSRIYIVCMYHLMLACFWIN